MSILGKRVIYVGPADDSNQKPLNVEGIALDAVAPGTLVALSSSGLSTSAAAATAFSQQLMVADKDQMKSKSVDDAWTINESMVAIAPRSGEFLNVIVAAGNNITSRGIPLSRNGAGLLKIAVTDGSEQILCYSDEIINVTADALVCVRIA